ncbi:protein kinase [Candidatus Parabeggiatoa sp. HSG14]|uniref:protein kinase domain-containing protein n=1 Tax=Candidatus Parabeggiatoa sp. HSG14 TaxID=3055593 RepID=UPI0025A74008|nr:protein kinase [Thiotrichales bacterium HSG14]
MKKIVLETTALNKFCINCMHNKGQHFRCPCCGYDEHKYKEHPLYLKPRTLLKNQYVMGLPLGQGGFGITYIGQDLWLQKKVAIKEYLPAAFATRDIFNETIIPLKQQEETFNKGLQLFIDEARNLAKFAHPNIVRVINFFEENQTGYMVMDYLEGYSLVDILNQTGGHLPVDDALTIVLPILDALTEVHAKQIYHRDISSQNIFILKSNIPILIDFGAARHVVGEHSRSLDLVLKHGYSPLEQYSGKGKIGPWTDIYACGALLYLMMTGLLPPAATDRFFEDNLVAPIDRNSAISSIINNAIMQALAIKLENRFQTVEKFRAALQGQLSTTVTIPLKKNPSQSPNRIFYKIHKKNTFLIATILLFLLIMILSNLSFYVQNETLSLKPLFKQAQIQWANKRLMIPAGNNAYETYQQILEIAPDNTKAQAGLKKIAEYYQQLALIAQKEGKLKESLQKIEQGLLVMPTHRSLQKFEHNLKNQIAKQQEAKTQAIKIKKLLSLAAQSLKTLQLEAALTAYQEILAIEPQNQSAQFGIQEVAETYLQLAHTKNERISSSLSLVNKGLTVFPNHPDLLALKNKLNDELIAQKRELNAKQSLKKKINQLFKKAEIQLKALRLTDPVGNNAYETYQKVLNIAPNNSQVQVGWKKIADKYEQLAHIKRSDLQKNLALIEKGLKVMPTHIGLRKLHQTITQQIQRAATKKTPSSHNVINEVQSTQVQKTQQPLILDNQSHSNKPVSRIEPLNKTNQASIPFSNGKLDKTVQKWLAIALHHFKANQFDLAISMYKNVLTVVPDNQPAKTGLQQIAQHYEQLAYIQKEQNHLPESLSLIEKGLTAVPTHTGLLALLTEVTQRLNEKKKPTETNLPQNMIFTPSF